MRLKEIPTTYREYYQTFHDAYDKKCDDTIKDIERLNIMINSIKDSIENKYELFKTKCKIDLHDYPEYISNKYDNGILDKDVKELFIKYSNNYEVKVFILILKRYVNSIKKITELNKKLEVYQKCRNITVKEYKNLLERYFTEVHKYIILDGYGYQLSPSIGVICFNRCKLVNARPKIDYKATRERKKALLDSGEHLFDKDEAEFFGVSRKNSMTLGEYQNEMKELDRKFQIRAQFEINSIKRKCNWVDEVWFYAMEDSQKHNLFFPTIYLYDKKGKKFLVLGKSS